MTINGTPAHPLVVHATVAAIPLMAVLAVVYVALPKRQPALRLWLLGGAIVLALLVWLTASTGDSLKEAVGASGQVAALIQKHEEWAGRLQAASWVFAAVAALTAFLDQRQGWMKGLFHALLVVGAITIVVFAVLTGDAGAQAVWYGVR